MQETILDWIEQLKNKIQYHSQLLKIIFLLIIIIVLSVILYIFDFFSSIYYGFISLESGDQIQFTALILTLMALFYQINAYRREAKFKHIDLMMQWLNNFTELLNSPERSEHDKWKNFAEKFINHADMITYLALRGYINSELMNYYKDPITSAYAIVYDDKSYLKLHFDENNYIQNLRDNLDNIKKWCKKVGWEFGRQPCPFDKKEPNDNCY